MARRLPGSRSRQVRPGRGQTISGPAEMPFRMHYPGGWRKVPKNELQRRAEPPVAGVRSADGRGVVTLTVRGPLARPLAEMRADFVSELEKRYAGENLEIVSSHNIETAAGTGMYTSWVLRDAGRVYGHLTVPVGDRSYTLDGIVTVGASDVAREVGSIIGSFEVARPE